MTASMLSVVSRGHSRANARPVEVGVLVRACDTKTDREVATPVFLAASWLGAPDQLQHLVMATVTAKSGFVAIIDGAYVVVQEGDEHSASDVVVKAHPDQFTVLPRRGGTSTKRKA